MEQGKGKGRHGSPRSHPKLPQAKPVADGTPGCHCARYAGGGAQGGAPPQSPPHPPAAPPAAPCTQGGKPMGTRQTFQQRCRQGFAACMGHKITMGWVSNQRWRQGLALAPLAAGGGGLCTQGYDCEQGCETCTRTLSQAAVAEADAREVGVFEVVLVAGARPAVHSGAVEHQQHEEGVQQQDAVRL